MVRVNTQIGHLKIHGISCWSFNDFKHQFGHLIFEIDINLIPQCTLGHQIDPKFMLIYTMKDHN